MDIQTTEKIHKNLSVAELVEKALARGEGMLAANGALVVRTGKRTGRSPADRFVVESKNTKDELWWGPVNKAVSPEAFNKLLSKAKDYLSKRDVFICDGFAGADPSYRLNVRVVSEKAWHSLFAKTLFLRPTKEELSKFTPQFTVINACELLADPKVDGTASEVFIGVDLEQKIILILGSHYAGEVKKGIFAVMNYILPKQSVFPMHCSANVGRDSDTSLFFGLSGTGKTTLSADPARRLIGDDEHGWSDHGIFNFEGGCYAKVIKLDRTREPQIWDAIRFGSVLENVVIDERTRAIDYDDGRITENTRATYPVEYIPNCVIPGVGGHPKNVIFLTCDAFGVLPPIAELTPEMAMYHFLSGYTAKVAGTEAGIVEPKETFSTCFGSPFLPLHPTVYAELLGKRIAKHRARCWLVNTGWSGGPYGVGKRMDINLTRKLLSAALSGVLNDVPRTPDKVFQILVPEACPDVPGEILNTRNTWKDKAAYDVKAKELAARFQKNFEQYAAKATQNVLRSGPVMG